MDDYSKGMTAAEEIKWCSNRILELYPVAESDFISAKDALNLVKSISKKKYHKHEKQMQCSYCGEPKVYAKGLCASCYNRLRIYGSPEYRKSVKCDDPEEIPDIPWYEKIRNVALGCDCATPDDLEDAVLYVLDTLNDREKKSILLKYRDGKTLYDIGCCFGVTKERARQIIVSGEQKLLHPSKKIYLELGLAVANETIAENKMEKEKAAKCALDNAKLKYSIQKERGEDMDISDIGIGALGLNVRSYNCLIRVGLTSIKDIIEFAGYPIDDMKLLKIRNLGRKSAEEIIMKMDRFMLDGDDRDDTPPN